MTPGLDCLNLNVFTPEGAGPDAGLPVLVWIHGGGFTAGMQRSRRGTAASRSRRGASITVSINYRLGAEGFLVIDGAPSNRAVLDWVAALEWVRDNIAAFGGDPAKVTIAGQSAGGAACATLLTVPAARGLFRGAICMSGSRFPTTPLSETAGADGGGRAEQAGVEPTLAGLSSVDPERLVDAQEAAVAAGAGRWRSAAARLRSGRRRRDRGRGRLAGRPVRAGDGGRHRRGVQRVDAGAGGDDGRRRPARAAHRPDGRRRRRRPRSPPTGRSTRTPRTGGSTARR